MSTLAKSEIGGWKLTLGEHEIPWHGLQIIERVGSITAIVIEAYATQELLAALLRAHSKDE